MAREAQREKAAARNERYAAARRARAVREAKEKTLFGRLRKEARQVVTMIADVVELETTGDPWDDDDFMGAL